MLKVLVISSLIPFITAFCCHPPSSFDAKLKLINHNNDHNNDSHVSLSDIRYDLHHHFDKNKDGKVDKVEFAVSWNCMYGDSFEYPLWLFNEIDRNHDNFIEVSDIAKGPIGHSSMTISAFEARNRQRYSAFNHQHIIG